jgi:DNA-binding SARP family transcriptional activator
MRPPATSPSPFRLELLGKSRLLGPAGEVRVERKMAALVAWLALEGPTPRQRLAELLWAGNEELARTNMRQLLRRLRLAADMPLVGGRELLSLAEDVGVDALELRRLVEAERYADALALEGELLGSFDYSDMEEFGSWLLHTRERLKGHVRRAVVAEVGRLERQGELNRALALAERHLGRDPHCEDAYRLLMRLHYLAGDRTAALGLYEMCKQMLQRELDARPSAETEALAREIAQARARPAAPAPVAPARAPLPPTVLRPPVLVGRERAWAEAEEAWSAGKGLYIAGTGGLGKSRLARDFAASKGAYLVIQGRPGDEHVPYSTTMRAFRQMLAQRPEVELEPWVRAELGRVMPEFADPSGALPPPMSSESDRVRFFEALSVVIRRCTSGLAAQLYDDFQFFDTATVVAGAYIFGNAYPFGEHMPHIIVCYRDDELMPTTRAVLRDMVESGAVKTVKLAPLTADEVAALLESTAVPGAAGLAGELSRYTGGNPLFITEALKHLLESGALREGQVQGALAERLPSQLGRVAPLIQRRLERLSRPALRLAQVAALAGTAFTLDVAGEVLEVPAIELDGPVAELEAAQILRGESFTHDLVFEATRAAIPEAVARLLHQRLAVALERRGAAPAVVAHHWLESPEPRRARPYLNAAAQSAESTLRHAEAAELRTRASTL